jgi:hypothetical protein
VAKPKVNPFVYGRGNLRDKLKPQRMVLTRRQIVQLKERALKLWNDDKGHAKELGKALHAVKKAVGHGKFKEWWQANGLVQSRVSYCLRLAQNKVAAAQAKRKSVEGQRVQKATQAVTKKLNRLFKACTITNNLLEGPAHVKNTLKDALGATIAQAATIAGWKLDTPEVKKAGDALERAIMDLVEVIARPASSAASAGA